MSSHLIPYDTHFFTKPIERACTQGKPIPNRFRAEEDHFWELLSQHPPEGFRYKDVKQLNRKDAEYVRQLQSKADELERITEREKINKIDQLELAVRWWDKRGRILERAGRTVDKISSLWETVVDGLDSKLRHLELLNLEFQLFGEFNLRLLCFRFLSYSPPPPPPLDRFTSSRTARPLFWQYCSAIGATRPK